MAIVFEDLHPLCEGGCAVEEGPIKCHGTIIALGGETSFCGALELGEVEAEADAEEHDYFDSHVLNLNLIIESMLILIHNARLHQNKLASFSSTTWNVCE